MSIAPNGDIFVADYWNRRIQRFNASFQYLSEIKVDSWGSPGITDRAYIVAMPDGRILATDPANGRIFVLDPQGKEERSWRLPAAVVSSRPIGIAFDATSQQVYISDSLANSVVKVPLAVLLAPPATPAPATAGATGTATAGATGTAAP